MTTIEQLKRGTVIIINYSAIQISNVDDGRVIYHPLLGDARYSAPISEFIEALNQTKHEVLN